MDGEKESVDGGGLKEERERERGGRKILSHLLRPDVDDDAADLVALGELLPDGGQQRVKPHGVERGLGVGALGDEDGPLAAVLALGVFPLRCFFFFPRGERKRERG